LIYRRSIATTMIMVASFLPPASTALYCPLLHCIYDEPRGHQRQVKRQRDREMVRLFTKEGKEIKELATRFGVSQRTVQRALKRGKNE